MATKNRKQTTALAAKIQKNPAAFDFFQAVRLLLHESKKPLAQTLEFKTSSSFKFPKGDIEKLQPATTDSKADYEMLVTFMSLVGSNGILPPHYTEQLLKQLQQKESGLRDFFDLLQQRSIALFYKAWEKHHFYVAYEHAKQQKQADDFSKLLYSLAGLGTKTMQQHLPINPDHIAFYAGYFASNVHSATNLKDLLSSFFKIAVTIKELQGEWLYLNPANCTRISQPHYLTNHNNRLGIDTSVGTRVWYCGHKFRVKLGPLNQAQLDRFLPNGDWFGVLQQLISLYVGLEFDFELQLILAAKYIKAPQLKKRDAPKLGWNSWLCSKPAQENKDDIILHKGENTYAIR